jgi:hypothetical protein
VKPYLEKPFTKIKLVEWFKVKAVNSSPSANKQQQQKQNCHNESPHVQ